MEFYASKEIAMDAIDKVKIYKVFAIINVIAFFISMVIGMSGYYPFTVLVVMAVTVFSAIAGYRKARHYDTQITDINDCYVRLDNDKIYCRQTAENFTYEECEIHLEDIESVLENNMAGKCGFYIKLLDLSGNSKIFINDKIEDRNLFYVNGLNYDKQDFKSFYREVRNAVPMTARVSGTLEQKSWDVISDKKEFILLSVPLIFIYVMAVIHLLYYVAVS